MSTSIFGYGALLLMVWAQTPATDGQIAVDGLVRLIEHVDVPARSEGRLVKIRVQEGDVVKKDDALGELNEEEARLTLKRSQIEQQLAAEKAQSETAILVAELTKDVANAEFERARNARQNAPSSISEREFERLKLEANKAGLELTRLSEERRFAFLAAQAKSLEVQMARLALDDRRIVSPLDGIVVQTFRREGEWVRPGEKAVRVVRIDRLRVEAFVPLELRVADWRHLPATLVVDGPANSVEEYAGEVVFAHPEADPVNGQVRIWAEVANRDLMLRPGQRGRLNIELKPNAEPTGRPLAMPPAKTQSR
jgi:RND family efflux transporter MFP subunit